MTERPNPGGQFSEPPKGLTPEARDRYTLWQPRYEALKTAITASRTRRDIQSDPDFAWMTPGDLGSYLLFRLDTIELAGGSNMEKIHQRQAQSKDMPYHDGARAILHMRLNEVESEIRFWDESSWEDFRYVHQHFSTPRFITPADLTPQQNALREILEPRLTQYEEAIQAGIGAEIQEILNDG